MGLRDLATVLIRLYGLLSLFYCLQTGQQVFIYIASPVPSEAMFRVGFISSIAGGILYAVTGVCLLVFAKNISGRVVPKTSDGLNILVSTADLGIVSFSLVGMIFFVDGVRWLVNDGIVWRFTPEPVGASVTLDMRMTASLVMSAIKVLFGVVLMFGTKGVLRAFRWAQGEDGHEWKIKRGDAQRSTIELPKISECPNCEAEYNPEDYRQDVSEWFCPRCGKALPKE